MSEPKKETLATPKSARRGGSLGLAIGIAGASLFLLACPHKPPPVIEEAAAPPPEVPEAGPVDLVPLTDDAGVDADAGPAPIVHRGPAVNPTYARLRQCCASLASQAASMPNSPEAQMMRTASTQCLALAQQATSGTAPELAPLRNILHAIKMPPVCQNL